MSNAHENIDTIINNQNTKDFFQLLGIPTSVAESTSQMLNMENIQSTGEDRTAGSYAGKALGSQMLNMENISPSGYQSTGNTKPSLLDEPISKKLLKSVFPPQWGRNFLEADEMMKEGYERHGTMSETFPYFLKGLKSDFGYQEGGEVPKKPEFSAMEQLLLMLTLGLPGQTMVDKKAEQYNQEMQSLHSTPDAPKDFAELYPHYAEELEKENIQYVDNKTLPKVDITPREFRRPNLFDMNASQKNTLNPKVKSIVQEHINSMTNKNNRLIR